LCEISGSHGGASEVLAASFIRAVMALMEAESTSETSVNFYQTTERKNPEDSHLHIRRHKNIKSHYIQLYVPLGPNWMCFH
jgi:hypothetical protein